MSSKSDAFETALLNLIFKNTNIAGIGDAGGLRGSVAAGNLYAAFFTADPGEAGSAVTNETAYTNYARQPVARGAGFTVDGNSVIPAANIDFPQCGATPGPALTYGGYVSSSAGAGMLLYRWQLKDSGGNPSPITLTANQTIPRMTTGTTVTED